jgi:thioredoxin-like negative regulator of GroEL
LRTWLPALPALISLLGVAAFFVVVSAQNSDRTTTWYTAQAATAMQLRDFKTARLCLGRLLTTSPTDPALLFGLAQSLDGMGQSMQSRQILNRLAPLDHPGYAPAHLLVAEQLLELQHTPDVMTAVEIHLRRVLEADPSNVKAQSLLLAIQVRR